MQTVAEAAGQTARFIKILEEYGKAPDVTRTRMYLETMERVFGSSNKIIIDNKSGQGVVPFEKSEVGGMGLHTAHLWRASSFPRSRL